MQVVTFQMNLEVLLLKGEAMEGRNCEPVFSHCNRKTEFIVLKENVQVYTSNNIDL